MESNTPRKVSLVSNLDEMLQEVSPARVWVVRPQLHRKYPNQRMVPTAELVDLNRLDLDEMQAFDTL